MRILRPFAVLLAIGSMVAVGFVGPASATTATAAKSTSVTVTAGKPSEYRFKLSHSTVKAGTVTFKIVNHGKIPHDFSIAGKKSRLLKPGKSTTLKVKLKKGKHAYKCTVPGHAAAGMKGTLKVT